MIYIVYLPYGQVLVGEYFVDGEDRGIRSGAVVRRWGTRGQGIGQIQMHGPTPETKLDPVGEVRWSYLGGEVMRLLCNQEAWAATKAQGWRNG
jgi:hypothetical protein